MRLAFLFLLLALSACTSPEPPSKNAPASSPNASADRTLAASGTLKVEMGRQLGTRPTAPLRIEGACPFECCTYGTWTTTKQTRVFRHADDTTNVAFTVPSGTKLDAGTGHILLSQIGTAVARDSVRLYQSHESYRLAAPGDTLLLLDYVGEGTYHVWHADSVYQTGLMAPSALEQIQEPLSSWWARVTTPGGREGWLWMNQTPPLQGVDACG